MVNVQKAGEIYRCRICGNVVMVKEAGGGEIICHMSRKGVFAAGDVTSVKGKQIIIAAGDGAKAALEASEYLMKKVG